MEKEKIVQVFIDDVHDYDYKKSIVDGVTYHTLYYSNSTIWDEEFRTKLIGCISDDGSRITFSGEIVPDKKKSLDYDQSEYLYILLRLMEIDVDRTYEIVEIKKTSF